VIPFIAKASTRQAGTMKRLVRSRPSSSAVLLAALSLAACAGTTKSVEPEIRGSRGQTLVVSRGSDFSVLLQTIGPGEYASPPSVSSAAVRFIDVVPGDIIVPAGPRQRFRFQAIAPGTAILVFHHTDVNPTVQDTIDVR
jgi:hypothetical protein